MKRIKAWGIFTKDGQLLSTDKEACIYSSHNEAVKEKGSYVVRSITISVHKPNDGTQEMIRDYWIKHEGLGICTCVPVQSEILKPKTKKEQKGWVKVKIVFPTKQKDFKCA